MVALSYTNPSEKLLDIGDILAAHERIRPHIHRTPLLHSSLLDSWLGHEVLFKAEMFQKMGAFKIRGALNALLRLREEGNLPRHVVAYSSGNHAQGVASACRMLGLECTLVMPRFVSRVKQQAAASAGAKLLLTQNRPEAEKAARNLAQQGAYFLHPSDNDDMIAGQGTACLEALQDGAEPDAIFAACGGGGLIAGTWLAAQALAPHAGVYGAEPLNANDAARSLRYGSIVGFDDTPATTADGARTLRVSERCFSYLKKLDGMLEVEEERICYWTQWLAHLLKVSVEPTAALAMAAAHGWLKEQDSPKRVLVILSGGNVDAAAQARIWQTDYLRTPPAL